jgi:uncharacterized BrkB/YihY/UPF0761 family membrane protein
LLSAVVNIATYLVAFRVLTPKQIRWRDLLPGAVAGGLVWTLMQTAGGYLVGRYVRSASPVYGFFALFLGLIFWIYLGAQVTLYCAELNVVLTRRWWPRGLVQPPLTAADQAALVAMAKQEERFKEEEVEVRFAEPESGDHGSDKDSR